MPICQSIEKMPALYLKDTAFIHLKVYEKKHGRQTLFKLLLVSFLQRNKHS